MGLLLFPFLLKVDRRTCYYWSDLKETLELKPVVVKSRIIGVLLDKCVSLQHATTRLYRTINPIRIGNVTVIRMVRSTCNLKKPKRCLQSL